MSESWIIERAKNSTNKYEAESWMLVAKTLGATPDLSLAAFEINCARKNASDAADCLQKLYMSAANDRFWSEVAGIVAVYRANNWTDELHFKKCVFEHMHKDIQQSLLLDLADRTTNPLDKTFIHLLLLQLFPDSALAYGIELLSTLRDGLKDSSGNELANNLHAQLLVSEALPGLLVCADLPVSDEMLVGLLRDALLILLSTVSMTKPHPPLFANMCAETSSRISSWLANPWTGAGGVLTLFKQFVTKNEWKVDNQLTDMKIETPSSYIDCLSKSVTNADQDFFCAMFALIRSADNYYKKLRSIAKDLISGVVECLTMGIQCLKKVQQCADSHLRDPDAFLAYDWLLKYICDCLAFEKKWDTLTDMINARITVANNVQMSSLDISYWHLRLFLCWRDSNKALAFKAIIQSIKAACDNINDKHIAQNVLHISIEDSGGFSLVAVGLCVELCVEYMLGMLTRVVFSASPSNHVLGSVLVMAQMHYRRWSTLIHAAMQQISRQGLDFPQFSKYVTSIDILEHMAYVHQTASAKLTLIISPDSDGLRFLFRKGAQNTRHSTKGVKEEISAVIHSQANKTHPPAYVTVMHYFRDEHETIMKCLVDA